MGFKQWNAQNQVFENYVVYKGGLNSIFAQ